MTVTDEAGEVVPRGTLGELRVSGAGVALGYAGGHLGGFVPAAEGEERTYRTGDRVLMRPEGVLEFHGRLDDQFKIDGVRLEPAEIEAALLSFPGVTSAAAFPFTTGGGIRQVGAALTTSPEPPAPSRPCWPTPRPACPAPPSPGPPSSSTTCRPTTTARSTGPPWPNCCGTGSAARRRTAHPPPCS